MANDRKVKVGVVGCGVVATAYYLPCLGYIVRGAEGSVCFTQRKPLSARTSVGRDGRQAPPKEEKPLVHRSPGRAILPGVSPRHGVSPRLLGCRASREYRSTSTGRRTFCIERNAI